MSANNLTEQLLNKWKPILDHGNFSKIRDSHRRAVTAVALENQRISLMEAAPSNNAGSFSGSAQVAANVTGSASSAIGSWDPILINMVRRALPNLVAYDVCGVQPMTGPTGLVFAMRSQYVGTSTRTEALFNEANTVFGGGMSGSGTQGTDPTGGTINSATWPNSPGGGTDTAAVSGAYRTGTGLATGTGEALGDGVGAGIAAMGISIDKVTVTAATRALKAEYTMELQQDLKAIHGLDAETELSNILSTEILAEINREVLRTIYTSAKAGAATGVTTAGTFDLNTDSNGRWSVERFKGLLFQLEREANIIAKETRRGKGNIVICSSDVASALSMAGVLDYAPALSTNLEVDDTGNTFAGTLNGKLKVYIDPYHSGSNSEFACVGYKGSNAYDAGVFYCPYVPLQLVRTVGQDNFQPKIAFRTRYGLVANPYALVGSGQTTGVPQRGAYVSSGVYYGGNQYYRLLKITNLM